MKVLIVEDETAAYENLTDILTEITPDIRIMANTESVTQTVGWLQSNPAPDHHSGCFYFSIVHNNDFNTILELECSRNCPCCINVNFGFNLTVISVKFECTVIVRGNFIGSVTQ